MCSACVAVDISLCSGFGFRTDFQFDSNMESSGYCGLDLSSGNSAIVDTGL